MFNFLGVNSKACRRRFLCEMEHRSNRDPLTAMAFRIVGRGMFGPYLNGYNGNPKANSFLECAKVNPDCTVIEEEDDTEEIDAPQQEEEPQEAEEIDETTVNEVENDVASERSGKNHLAEMLFSRSK